MAFVPSSASRPSLTIRLERRGRTRQLSLGGTASLLIGAALVLIGIWALAATIYLAFRDDLMGVVMQRQQQWRYVYEDRIAALRAQMDRVTSRQLVDQDGFEGKVQELLARQAQLESRQAVVNALMTQAAQSLQPKGPPGKVVAASPARLPDVKISETRPSDGKPADGKASDSKPAAVVMPRAAAFAGAEPALPTGLPALRGSGEGSPLTPPVAPRRSVGTGPFDPAAALPPPGRDQKAARETSLRLGQLSRSLDGVAGWQEASLVAVEGSARAQALRLKGVLAEVGLDDRRFRARGVDPAKSDPRLDMANEGGPFVPVAVDAEDGPFGAAVDRLQRSLTEAEHLRQVVAAVPLARPLPGDPEVTSGFGTRVDPFTRGVALHTGVDLKDDYGSPVRVTAPGVVTAAEWTGGYGNMVEVDHGNGLATRYGHLSAIGVSVGERVETGAVIGRLGSTGRSTGPHLHYETRIDGEPVDPIRFLRVAKKLASGD